MQDHTLTYWQTSLQYIKQNVPADIYKASFEPLQFVSFDEGLLKVGVPNKLFAELFESNYAKYFLQVVSHYCGRSVRLKYVIEQKPAENVAPNPLQGNSTTDADKNAAARFATQPSLHV